MHCCHSIFVSQSLTCNLSSVTRGQTTPYVSLVISVLISVPVCWILENSRGVRPNRRMITQRYLLGKQKEDNFGKVFSFSFIVSGPTCHSIGCCRYPIYWQEKSCNGYWKITKTLNSKQI